MSELRDTLLKMDEFYRVRYCFCQVSVAEYFEPNKSCHRVHVLHHHHRHPGARFAHFIYCQLHMREPLCMSCRSVRSPTSGCLTNSCRCLSASRLCFRQRKNRLPVARARNNTSASPSVGQTTKNGFFLVWFVVSRACAIQRCCI